MSQLTEFITFFSGYISTVLDYAIITIVAVIIGSITVTELIKKFNPNISTTKGHKWWRLK